MTPWPAGRRPLFAQLTTTPPTKEWRVEPLSANHECGFLSTGRSGIDDWFSDHAQRLQETRTCVTYVWSDQPPYVSGFFTLTPHRIDDEEARIPGHAGGTLSGYLIAKIGVHEGAVDETIDLKVGPEASDVVALPPIVGLLIEAIVKAARAAFHGGGRWLFIDTTNEPPHVLSELETLGFKAIKPEGSALHFIKLGRPEQ